MVSINKDCGVVFERLTASSRSNLRLRRCVRSLRSSALCFFLLPVDVGIGDDVGMSSNPVSCSACRPARRPAIAAAEVDAAGIFKLLLSFQEDDGAFPRCVPKKETNKHRQPYHAAISSSSHL